MHHYWLASVWFGLIAILWTGYFFLEGFDFGVGILLPVLGRNDGERRVLVNSIGPFWDANEVWLLVAGGATFAAFPQWYATLFAGFYLPLFLILMALIARGVAFEFRRLKPEASWRAWWDRAIFLGSALPALLWGVAWANILRGTPINAGHLYTGNLLTLLNPYALLGGVMTLALFSLHGAVFLTLRTTGEMLQRARGYARKLAWPAAAAVVGFLVWTYFNAVHGGGKGLVPPFLPVAAMCLVVALPWLLSENLDGWAFLATALTIVAITATIFLNLYPRVMPSSLGSAFNLTIDNASSSHYTLRVMTIVAAIFTPVVLAYQSWTYWVFRKRVTGGREAVPASAVAAPGPPRPD
ncbi:MAG TPA: cytochrome d ubiquinol oxidase subunit II [Acidimicrobiales bacterium]|nr:cytochrome d ubiquinol oxidase subunit II [Acidimicrobiales bacterium]